MILQTLFLVIAGLSGFFIYMKSVQIFLRINAKNCQHEYQGFFRELLSLKPNFWFQGKYIDIFPLTGLSILFNFRSWNDFTTDRGTRKLYLQKITLEIILGVLFIVGLILIYIWG